MPGSITSKRGRGPVGAVEGGCRADPLARQIFGQHLAQGGVVIDKKNVQNHLPQGHENCARKRALSAGFSHSLQNAGEHFTPGRRRGV
jgi:hypothetical protein